MILRRIVMCMLWGSIAFADMDVINGTTAIVTFDANTTLALKQGEKILPLVNHPTDETKRIAVIPIPYRQTDSIDLLHVGTSKTQTIRLHVRQGAYLKERLTVESKKVHPPKSVQERIAKEYQEAIAIYQTYSSSRYWADPFVLPMESAITSAFGTARLFNESLKSFHSGTDFRAAVGSNVHAVNDGIVVLAKERYYAGGSVLIDHGEGVYSCYYHLSSMIVNVGQKVRQGEIIGASGQSGRVTGPHLHLAFMVQGVQVDPLDFMEKVNRLFGNKGVQ